MTLPWGWYEKIGDYDRDRLQQYVGCISPEGIHWTLIRLALLSVANQAIIPLQDVLGYGSDCRMNTPGLSEGNWGWRYQPEVLTDEIRHQLRSLTELSNRNPKG
jgi:4-alpha-glucanotransferase